MHFNEVKTLLKRQFSWLAVCILSKPRKTTFFKADEIDLKK